MNVKFFYIGKNYFLLLTLCVLSIFFLFPTSAKAHVNSNINIEMFEAGGDLSFAKLRPNIVEKCHADASCSVQAIFDLRQKLADNFANVNRFFQFPNDSWINQTLSFDPPPPRALT